MGWKDRHTARNAQRCTWACVSRAERRGRWYWDLGSHRPHLDGRGSLVEEQTKPEALEERMARYSNGWLRRAANVYLGETICCLGNPPDDPLAAGIGSTEPKLKRLGGYTKEGSQKPSDLATPDRAISTRVSVM